MNLPELQAHQYQAELFTEHYLFAGTLQPLGMLMTYLNHGERRTLRLKDVTATNLDVGSTVGSFRTEELFIRRDQIVAIRLFVRPSVHTVPLLPHSDRLRLFLPRFAVQAVFHRGTETRLNDLFETVGLWAPATDAQIYATQPTKHPIAPEAPMLLVQKEHIQFYQPVPEQQPAHG